MLNVEADMEKEIIVTSLVQELSTEQEKAKELVSNTAYILWLENFTKVYPKFTDDLHEHYPDELTADDCQKISDLYLFFKGIDDYASKNLISSQTEELSFPNEYYVIVYNNIYYQIGIVSGQGTFAYCDRIKNPSTQVLDFNDVINNKQAKNFAVISKKIENLTQIVESLNYLNVPTDVIINTVEKALDKSHSTKKALSSLIKKLY